MNNSQLEKNSSGIEDFFRMLQSTLDHSRYSDIRLTVSVHVQRISSPYGNVVQEAKPITPTWIILAGNFSKWSSMMAGGAGNTESVLGLVYHQATTTQLKRIFISHGALSNLNEYAHPFIQFLNTCVHPCKHFLIQTSHRMQYKLS